MKKRILKKIISLVLVLSMVIPSSFVTALAEETAVIVDDTVTDSTLDHYFTYTEATDSDGLTGWASDTKTSIAAAGTANSAGNDIAQTQHWVWNTDYSEASKHTYTFTFKGTGVELIGVKNDDQNTFQMDDGEEETFTITGAAYTPVTIYSKRDLEYGTHTVSVTLPEGGTGLQVCYAKVYGADGETDSDGTVYEYEKVSVVNPISNSWYEPTSEVGDGPAEWAFDGTTATWWHTNWGEAADGNMQSSSAAWTAVSTIPAYSQVSAGRTWIGGEFGEAIELGKFTYEGRTDKQANWLGQYALYTANVTGRDVTDADFTLAYTSTNSGYSPITVTFDTPITATHFRIVAFTATYTNFVTAAEIEMYEAIPADTTPGFSGSIVDIDTQYTQDRFSEVKRMSTTSAALSAWKNDKALSEIALVAKYAAYTNVTVTASDLTDGNGNTISSDNVTATFIKSTKAYNGSFLGYGDPDRAVPADTGTNRSESSDILYQTTPVDMAENTVQPVWVEFDIPKNAVAGTYIGTIEVTADELEAPLTFTYTVEVQDATLADATEFADTFDIMQWQYPYSSAEYYGVDPFSEEHLKILESIMGIYKEVGGNAITTTFTEEAWSGQTYSANPIHYPSMVKWTKNSDGSFSYDYSDFDAWVSFCKGMGLGDKIVAYGIAPWHFSFTYWEEGATSYTKEAYTVGNDRYIEVWGDFLTDFAAHLETMGWKENVYIGIDERSVNSTAFDVAEAAGLKTAADIDNITNHWEIAQRVIDLNVGDTAAQTYSEKFAELLAIRDAKGYKTTLYSCTEHQPGQFSLSAPVESYWAVLNAGMMGADGFNRWAYDAWVADPLNDTTHNAFEPGDCFVIFPDEKDAENPEAKYSVRLARMAEGVRDVNKLAQMVKEIPSLSDEVEEVYDNIQYTLNIINTSYMSDSAVTDLAAETNSFKADLAELTETYILLRDGGTDVVESVTINEGSSAEVQKGNTLQLSVSFAPENLVNTNANWTSSNESVATVSRTGLVTAVQEGTAVITAVSDADESKTAEILITVTGIQIDDEKKVSYYSFDNVTGTELVDEWGDRDGVILGSTAEGRSGNALSVTEAGVGAAIDSSLNTLDTDWTIGYWVKTTADFTSEISVLEDAAKEYSFSMKMASDRDSGFRVGDESGDVLTYAYSFAADTWYYMTWVQDKDVGLFMYVNGVLVQNNTWTIANTITAPIDVIGGTGFTGLIDEVKIFDAVLTQEEIASIMQVNGINVSEDSVEINIGETYNINASVISDNDDKTITYTSSNEDIATVSAAGVITAKGIGRAVITLTAPGGYEVTVSVKVSKEVNILNELTIYDLPEEYQSNVEGAAHDEEGTLEGTDRQYLGQPDMVQTDTGRLITVFPTGHGHGPLIMKYSDDEGETWTEMDTPDSWDESQETPTIYSLRMEDGSERLVLICACPGTWGNYTTGWDFSYSDDNGETWTEFEHFWSTFSDGTTNDVIVGMASLIQLKDADGNYIQKWMGVYHNGSFVNYKTYLTFDENGEPEWSEPVAYLSEYSAIESSHWICEVGMFRSPDGERIVALARNQTHAGPATMFYSDDEGETWSEPVELPGSLAGERHKAMYDPISDRLLITFREIDYDRDNDGSWEGGSDWIAGDWVAWVGTYEDLMNLEQGDYMIRLDEDFAANYYSGDCGYTGMAVLEDGTFVLHSYGHWDQSYSQSYVDSATGAYNVKTDLCWIRQAKFKIADVENEYNLVDYTELETCIENSAITSDVEYTEESFSAYEAALTKAEAMVTAKNVQQVEVDAMIEELTEAYEGLTEKAAEITNPFEDVYETDFYYNPVLWAVEKGVTSGKSETLFAPGDISTRGDVVTFMWRAAGRPEPTSTTCTFTDVSSGAYYYKAVLWAVEKGITSGTSEATFEPSAECTRAQVVSFLWRAAGRPAPTSTTHSFTDMAAGAYYENAVLWAVEKGITAGTSQTTFEPEAKCTRGQIVTFLYRYYN